VHGDIRCRDDFLKLKSGYDVLIECAAEPSVLAGMGSGASRMIDTNLLGAVNCFEYAREQGAAVLFISTSRVYPYDQINALRFSECATRVEYADEQDGVTCRGVSTAFRLDGRRSLYGATKLSAEYILQEYSEQYGLNSIINRCGVIAGPWQLGKVDQGVFTHWLVAHHLKRPLTYVGFGGAGLQVRDLLHIDDFVALVVKQIAQIADHHGRVFNVGGSSLANLSLMEATALCQEITGHEVNITSDAANRPADVIWFVTDNGDTESIFDWRPRNSARGILEDTYSWLCGNEDTTQRLFGR
jgi:CDP-paratose 2-epimerase